MLESDLPSRLKFTAAAVAFLFAHNEQGEGIRPSVARVGWVTSKSERAARADIAELCAMGVLVPKTPRLGSGGRARRIWYTLNADALPKRPPFEFESKHGGAPPGCQQSDQQNPEAGFRVATKPASENPEVSSTKPGSFEHKPGSLAHETRKPASADPLVDPLVDSLVDPRTAASPRFSTQAKEPNGNNFKPIARIIRELLTEKPYADQAELVDDTKQRCAELGVDYGRDERVPFNVVHRAVASEWFKFRNPEIVTPRSPDTQPLPLRDPGRAHKSHVPGFCDWVCFPEIVFGDFQRRVIAAGATEGDAGRQVTEWALSVRRDWQGRIPGDDIFDFWRNEWKSEHGSNKPAVGGGIDVLAGFR